jgi:hypothetical protein
MRCAGIRSDGRVGGSAGTQQEYQWGHRYGPEKSW